MFKQLISVLVPGTVVTDVWKVIPDSGDRIAEAKRRSPTGRVTTPEEVAYAAQFLCSDAASGLIGQSLVVDCGAGIVA